MKKNSNQFVILLTLTIILCWLPSCTYSKSSQSSNKSTTFISSNHSTALIPSDETAENPRIYRTETSSIKDVGGEVISVQKYRAMFYSVPAPFVNIVGRDEYFAWEKTIDITSDAEKMVMPQFIQHFGITREQFDKANVEWARIIRDQLAGRPCINPKDYANQITDEIFNGDIIFTFDDDLIREYYLSPDYPYLYDFEFEEAVANGEYTSQTEEWVDVDQMEAEINEKYGVPETTDTND